MEERIKGKVFDEGAYNTTQTPIINHPSLSLFLSLYSPQVLLTSLQLSYTKLKPKVRQKLSFLKGREHD
jgi:hypothetical protein